MAKSLNDKIDFLTDAISKLVNNPIAPIAPVAPVAPVLPVLERNTGDHDLLTKLDTKVDQIQCDVSELKKDKNIYVTQLEHAEVIRVQRLHDDEIKVEQEKTSDLALIRKLVFGCVGTILILVLTAIVYLVIQK
jgi:hypothetical protein